MCYNGARYVNMIYYFYHLLILFFLFRVLLTSKLHRVWGHLRGHIWLNQSVTSTKLKGGVGSDPILIANVISVAGH